MLAEARKSDLYASLSRPIAQQHDKRVSQSTPSLHFASTKLQKHEDIATKTRPKPPALGRTSSLRRPLRVSCASLNEQPSKMECDDVLNPLSSSSNHSDLSTPLPLSTTDFDDDEQFFRPSFKKDGRRHSCLASSVSSSEIVNLRLLSHRRYSSARREESLTKLLEQFSKPVDPVITCWMTRKWVNRQRRKAMFLRGLFMGIIAGLSVKLLMISWRLLIRSKNSLAQ